jgi:hypothetical protein
MGEPLVVGFPNVSSSVVVNAFVAELLAVALKADDVIANLTPVAAVMVSVWVAEVNAPDAVIVGVPGFVSP